MTSLQDELNKAIELAAQKLYPDPINKELRHSGLMENARHDFKAGAQFMMTIVNKLIEQRNISNESINGCFSLDVGIITHGDNQEILDLIKGG
jgi:hypothetical protein